MKVIARSLLLGSALLAPTFVQAADKGLEDWNRGWQQLMNSKDSAALANYYDDASLLANFPYDSSKNLQGITAISAMFTGGPFNLKDLKAQIETRALASKGDTGLLLKHWDISFDKGGFNGLALEVLTRDGDSWKRRIDLGAGGQQSAADLASQDTEADNSAFDGIAAKLPSLSIKAERINLSDAASALKFEAASADNLLSIQQGDYGLLISRINSTAGEFVTFNALRQQAGKWQVEVQMVEAL